MMRIQVRHMANDDVTIDVSPIRSGEENDGALQSTDLFVEGRGISLLINITKNGVLTYCLSVDRQRQSVGTMILWQTASEHHG